MNARYRTDLIVFSDGSTGCQYGRVDESGQICELIQIKRTVVENGRRRVYWYEKSDSLDYTNRGRTTYSFSRLGNLTWEVKR